ncbi:MAG: transglycosylase SLT domain-containing protein, partial [Thermoplasmata archaeon]
MADPSKAVLEAIARNTHPKVPYPVALAMGERETGFDPTKRGAAGEIGLFQLLPKTVREELRYMGPLEALFDPNLNTRLATQYLDILFRRFGTWPVAIRAYNGSGPASRAYAAGVLG